MTNTLERSFKWYEAAFNLSLECAGPLWPIAELDFAERVRGQLIRCFQGIYEELLGNSSDYCQPAGGYDGAAQVVVRELTRFDREGASKAREKIENWVDGYYVLSSNANVEQSWILRLLQLRNYQEDAKDIGFPLPADIAASLVGAFEQEFLHSPYDGLIALAYANENDSAWDRRMKELYQGYGDPLDMFVQFIEVKRFRAYWKGLVTRLSEAELKLLHEWYLNSVAQLKYAPRELPSP